MEATLLSPVVCRRRSSVLFCPRLFPAIEYLPVRPSSGNDPHDNACRRLKLDVDARFFSFHFFIFLISVFFVCGFEASAVRLFGSHKLFFFFVFFSPRLTNPPICIR